MIEPINLEELEATVARALASGDEHELRILGYGEVSLVVGWPNDDLRVACKRLPVFPDDAACERYTNAILDYVAVLHERGVDVLDTEVRTVPCAGGGVTAYVVQPVLSPDALGPNVLRDAEPDEHHPFLEAIVATTVGALTPRVGLDAQLSNWAWVDGRLRYLDVTTPFAWNEDGSLVLDLPILVRSLPWLMRAPVRRFLLPGVIAKYREPRPTLVDFCGNLHKERLDAWVPAAVAAANRRVEPAVTEVEVRKYYASDARLWDVMLRVRRLDRGWQRTVRRRPYPFLLPGPIER